MLNQIIHGDCFDVLKDIPDNYFDSLVCDPPSSISFMGKEWDNNKGGMLNWINWLSEIMAECLRVMKPGACGLIWSLPRTSHWTGMALELAGFKIIDIVHHCNGSGFPKGQDVSKLIDQLLGKEREVLKVIPDRWTQKGNCLNFSTDRKQDTVNVYGDPLSPEAKQWDGWKTPALKPAVEDWWLVQKPISESSIARNILKHGVGGLNIEACRIESKDINQNEQYFYQGDNGNSMGAASLRLRRSGGGAGSPSGRYPANLILSCGANCKGDEHSPDCPVSVIDRQTEGTRASKSRGGSVVHRTFKNEGAVNFGMSRGEQILNGSHFNDGEGKANASRFFKQLPFDPETVPSIYYQSKASPSDRSSNGTVKNTHPTVKSRHLMKYLITLITPDNGIVLDPFCGSGTTAIACKELGRNYICIEKEKEYFDIACKRVNQPRETVENNTILENFNQENIPEFKQLSLF